MHATRTILYQKPAAKWRCCECTPNRVNLFLILPGVPKIILRSDNAVPIAAVCSFSVPTTQSEDTKMRLVESTIKSVVEEGYVVCKSRRSVKLG
jgi:hypothetical protein